jgi:uncharacterized protein YecE (DUF72 family)
MGTVLLGTSSWSEAGWNGVFYPRGLAPEERLRHYAASFRTVEADNTYYRIPAHSMVRGWAERTPPGFVVAAKFPRSVVHGGETEKPDGARALAWEHVGPDAQRFLGAMAELGGKCGPLVLQFPYFNLKAFPGPEPFLERLDDFLGRLPPDFRYAVEVRNKAWVAPGLLELLRAHRAAFVLLDLAYMPHPDTWWARLPLITTDFAYVRLIGDRKAVEALTDTFDRAVIDRGESLARWAELIALVETSVAKAYVYANNHFAGYAIETVRQLRELLAARGVESA